MMTQAEANAETMRHILTVRSLMSEFASALLDNAKYHDLSKLEEPEASTFRIYTEKLKGMTYGSDEYKQCLADMKPALDHHYAHNDHHPEHFDNGINDMNLFDIVEMLCDWKAATLRHADGDINKSLEINRVKLGIEPQLMKILENTVLALDDLANSARLDISYPKEN